MLTPLTRESLRGIWAALITPWDAADQLDEPRLAEEVSAYGGTGILRRLYRRHDGRVLCPGR